MQKTIYRKPVDFVAPGVRVGSFKLNPGVELGWENNDNIFYFSRDAEQIGLEKIGDNIFHVRPWLDLKSDWNRHALNLHAFVDAARYKDYDSQNYTDWVVRLDGRIDVKSRSAFNYSAGYWRLHENRGSPENQEHYGADEIQYQPLHCCLLAYLQPPDSRTEISLSRL